MTRGAAAAVAGALAMALALAMVQGTAALEESRRFDGPGGPGGVTLRVASTADLSSMAPVVRAFLAVHPGVSVRYDQASSRDVHRYATAGAPDGSGPYDLAISSAMDLQVKLANDGAARPHRSAATRALPRAMRWRDRVFGFTVEPAAIAYNPRLVGDRDLPRTRFELLEFLRRHRDEFRGRIVTYDVRTSGSGYLLATQDSLQSDTYWRLMEVFGDLGTRLSCCTAEMLDLVESGEAAIAYNVLGSYAYGRIDGERPIRLVLPEDYLLVMTRSALLPRDAARPELAGAFVDFLLSGAGQRAMDEAFGIARTRRLADRIPTRPIRLDPALLVYLDRMKRRAFLDEWGSAVAERE